MKQTKDIVTINLRLPRPLYEQLRKLSYENGRSMNGEMVQRLKKSVR